MSREWEIFSEEDFLNMVSSFGNYFKLRQEKNLPFQKLKIISKKYQRPKTSDQHRKYWALIGKLKPLFTEAGYRVNEEDIHQYIKTKSGFTRILDGVIFTKSISDLSDDATIEALNNLIEFVIEFAAETFDVDLEKNDNLAQ